MVGRMRACLSDARMPVMESNPLVDAAFVFVKQLIWKRELRIGSLGINIDRLWNDIETLTTFSAGNEGVNHLTFSDEDRAARVSASANGVGWV